MRFFAPERMYPPAGVFSAAHFVMLGVTIVLIALALWLSRNATHAQVRRIIRILTAVLWGLEICKILFNFSIGNIGDPNTYAPLYFCSLALYAGLLSSVCTGKLQRVGDVFLATGNLVGGVTFLLLPISSMTVYPAMHFIVFHSFILHGVMTYLSLLILMRGFCKPKKTDFFGYFLMLLLICIAALLVNLQCGTNLMFISQSVPGTPLALLYDLTGALFTPLLILGQATVPFWGMYGILTLVARIRAGKRS